MKVLQLNCVYGKGSTGRITKEIHEYLLSKGVESVVLYGRGEKITAPGVSKVCGEIYAKANNLLSRLTGIMYAGCYFSTRRIIKRIKKENPDVVHLQCINGYFVNIYKLVSWLKKNNIRTVITLHAEFMYTANCGHAFECEKWLTGCGSCPVYKRETLSIFRDGTAESFRRMKRAFDGFDNLRIVSVSPWLCDRAKRSPMLSDKEHSVIFNGVDTDTFTPSYSESIRKKYVSGKEKMIFHATAEFSKDKEHPKGGYYIYELAEKLKDDGYRFVVAGKKSGEITDSDNLIYIGEVKDARELAQLYSSADLTVLTSKRETFSMVAAESLCCGTPVAGFKAGGPEMIALPDYSIFCDFGDVEGLKKEIICLSQEGRFNKNEISAFSQKVYSSAVMAENYFELYRSML